jgi:hypothetical protein
VSRPGFLGLIPSGTQNSSSRCFPGFGRSAAYCATRWFRARSPASSPKLARAYGTTEWAKFTTPCDQRGATTGTQLLRPMGISAVPATIESAVEAFVARRDALEQQLGISVDRALEGEVRHGIARVLDPR